MSKQFKTYAGLFLSGLLAGVTSLYGQAIDAKTDPMQREVKDELNRGNIAGTAKETQKTETKVSEIEKAVSPLKLGINFAPRKQSAETSKYDIANKGSDISIGISGKAPRINNRWSGELDITARMGSGDTEYKGTKVGNVKDLELDFYMAAATKNSKNLGFKLGVEAIEFNRNETYAGIEARTKISGAGPVCRFDWDNGKLEAGYETTSIGTAGEVSKLMANTYNLGWNFGNRKISYIADNKNAEGSSAGKQQAYFIDRLGDKRTLELKLRNFSLKHMNYSGSISGCGVGICYDNGKIAVGYETESKKYVDGGKTMPYNRNTLSVKFALGK